MHPLLSPAELRFVVDIAERLKGQSAFADVIEAAAGCLVEGIERMPFVEGEDASAGIAEPLGNEERQAHRFACASRTDEQCVAHIIIVQVETIGHTALCRCIEERLRVRRHERRRVDLFSRPNRRNRHQVNVIAGVGDDAAHLGHAIPGHRSKECINRVDVLDPARRIRG